MKQTLLYCLVAFFFCPVLMAQKTPAETLEQAYKNYDRIALFSRSLSTKTMTEADLNKIQQETQENISLLEPVVASGIDSLAIPATYYQVLSKYEYAQALAMKGAQEPAFAAYRNLEPTINAYVLDRFPISFTVADRTYSAYYSDFEPVLASFNSKLSGFHYANGDVANALPYARKAQATGMLEYSENVINYYRIVEMKIKNGESDRELIEMSLSCIENYLELTTEERDAADAQGMKSGLTTCLNAIAETQDKQPTLAQGGDYWARASRIYVLQKDNGKAIELANKAMDNGFEEREFLLSTVPIAQSVNDKKTAKRALDAYAKSLGDAECSALRTAADQYKALEENSLSNKYAKRADDCERKNNRVVNGRDGGLYLGTYIYPLFRTDWGAVLGLQTRKAYIEFSYQELSDRRDRLYDLRLRGVDGASDLKVRWDGYYSHVGIHKVSGKKGRRSYNGVLLAYNQRNYQPIEIPTILENNIAINTSPVIFRPKEERYILMLNSGTRFTGRFWALDSYFGLGGAWSVFERGVAPAFDGESFNYNNALLDGRKEARFSVMVRVGFTIGLQIGPRTFGK